MTKNGAGTPVGLTGCSKLLFPPSITVKPDTTNASSSSGLTVGVHVPQTAAQNPEGLAESALRDTTVALPAGVAINPSGGDGLEGCSEGLAGFEIGRGVNGSGFEEFNPESEPGVLTPMFTPTPIESLLPGVSLCPDGSKIGTVKIRTPLLEHELEGSVYLARQEANPFGSLVAMYLMVEDPYSGSTIKLTGEVRLCEAAGEVIEGVTCQGLGQIITTFKNTPDSRLKNCSCISLVGNGRRWRRRRGAGRIRRRRCSRRGTATGRSHDLELSDRTRSGWRPVPGREPAVQPVVDGRRDEYPGGCVSAVDDDDEPQRRRTEHAVGRSCTCRRGCLGLLSGVELCPEPQANAGTCGPESLIGETTVSVGVGNQTVTVKGGKFYLTGKRYCRAPPFGLSIVARQRRARSTSSRHAAQPSRVRLRGRAGEDRSEPENRGADGHV